MLGGNESFEGAKPTTATRPCYAVATAVRLVTALTGSASGFGGLLTPNFAPTATLSKGRNGLNVRPAAFAAYNFSPSA